MDKCSSVSAEFPKNWEKGEVIGRGRFGAVFLVVDKDNPQDKKFVVKERISSSDSDQTCQMREIEILRLLNHKRIVPSYGLIRREDNLYIGFGYMKKGSLADYVAKEDGLSEEKTRLFTRQILKGVNYLHSQTPSIIHKNIKGRHVLLEDENNIRLSGFDLAQTVHDFTNARTEEDTDKWMAPEVVTAAGNECYGVKVDIWSIACTVVEMITKEPPFPGLTVAQMMKKIAQRCLPEYNLPKNSSEDLRNFLTRTFKYDPLERPTSEELLKDTFITEFVDIPEKWTKGRLISTGSHGNVYIVRDEANPDDEKFVVKEIITTDFPWFDAEIHQTYKVNYEKIVSFYGLSQSKNTLSLFMKNMKMGTLENYIKTKGPLSEEQAQQFTKDILEGVQFLHENRFIHGHISGKHIFLESEKKVKLGGFRVSKMFYKFWIHKRLQKKSKLISPGSINWMAPEMVAAIMDDQGSTYDEKVDIWSVGCTVVQMVTGNPPFIDLEQKEITFQLASGKPPIYSLPEHSSPAIKNFLYQAFHFQASLRPSANDLVTKDEFIRREADSSTDCSLTNTPDHVLDTELPQCGDANRGRSVSDDQFLVSLKCYWLKVIHITGQHLVLEYFHESSHNISPWFERMKGSNVTNYLEGTNAGTPGIHLRTSKVLSSQEMTDTLVFTSLILSYSNRLLNILKNPLYLRDNKVSSEVEELIDIVEAVSSTLTRFQALLPWSVSAWLNEVDEHTQTLQTKVDHMCKCSLDDQQLAIFNFSKNLVVYDVDILCSVLGLDTKFSEFAKQVSVDMWLHDLQADWVLTWVKCNNENLQQDEPTYGFTNQLSVVKQNLILLGFSECKSATIADDITDDWINHQSALDLATSHILDMFQCHPVLTETSDFPYNNRVTGNLFQQTVHFSDGKMVAEHTVNMINVFEFKIDETRNIIQKHIQSCVNRTDEEVVKYFHGSSHADVISILTEGIKLKVGNGKQDFSDHDGFYLSQSLNHARERAWNRGRPAVIVYSIRKSTLQQFTELRLVDETETEEWIKLIKYCRKGYNKINMVSFADCHYVTGPMCSNPRDVISYGEEPNWHDPMKMQMCIRSAALADIFNIQDNIACVIFYQKTRRIV